MTPELDEIARLAAAADVPDPNGASTDRARMALIEHISAAPETPRTGQGLLRRRTAWWSAAAAGSLAAGLAGVAVVAGSGGSGSLGGARAHRTVSAAVPARAHGHAPVLSGPVVHGTYVLRRLAASVAGAPVLPGNATLVVHTNVFEGGEPSFSGDDLFEDNGNYFYGSDLTQLRAALAAPNSADPSEGKVINAAAASANASPEQAADAIYEASPAVAIPARTIPRAMISKLPAFERSQLRGDVLPGSPVTAVRRDNILWLNIGTALEGGSGRPAVRAGALLAASVLPGVSVSATTFDGTPVVQVTETDFPGLSSGYDESYEVDAQTAVLLNYHDNGPGSVSVTYHVSRVTTPSLAPAN
ncbi:MAG: hypothetical protein WAL22_21965 [Solirubrobacteraceae bacterium]